MNNKIMEKFGTYYYYSRNQMQNTGTYLTQKNKVLMKKKKSTLNMDYSIKKLHFNKFSQSEMNRRKRNTFAWNFA